MTQQEKEARALRRQIAKALVATDVLFNCRTVDREGFADKERQRLRRLQLKKQQSKVRRIPKDL